MQKQVYISVCIFFILFLFGLTDQAKAETPSVIDCLEDEAACEGNMEDGTPKQEDHNDQASTMGKGGSLFFSIVKTIVALLLVLALIYLLIKFLSKRNKLFQQVKSLENLGGIGVGQNKSIQIIRIGSQLFLVGVGENVELLQEITDERVKQDLLCKDEDSSNISRTSQRLPTFLQQKTGERHRTKDFKQLFSQELDKLKENRQAMVNQHKQKEDEHE